MGCWPSSRATMHFKMEYKHPFATQSSFRICRGESTFYGTGKSWYVQTRCAASQVPLQFHAEWKWSPDNSFVYRLLPLQLELCSGLPWSLLLVIMQFHGETETRTLAAVLDHVGVAQVNMEACILTSEHTLAERLHTHVRDICKATMACFELDIQRGSVTPLALTDVQMAFRPLKAWNRHAGVLIACDCTITFGARYLVRWECGQERRHLCATLEGQVMKHVQIEFAPKCPVMWSFSVSPDLTKFRVQ